MFSAIVRAVLILVAGSLIALALSMAGGGVIDAMEGESPDESSNMEWVDRTIVWFPGMVIASIVGLLIANAVSQRRAVR